MKNLNLLNWLLAISMVLFFVSCSDEPTIGGGMGMDDIDDNDDNDTEEPMESPFVPDANPAELDLSYFNNLDNSSVNNSQEEYNAILEGEGHANDVDLALKNNSSIGDVFFGLAESSDAEFSDGEWEWAYNFEEQGETITLRLTAVEVTDGIDWAMYISGNFSEFNQSVDEFLFISGFTSSDRSVGNWSYYFPESGDTPVMSYEWEVTSETEYTFASTINEPDDGTQMLIEYVRSGDENTLNNTGDDLPAVQVYWNTDTMTGYIEEDGDRRCWDDTFAETACS